jgi:hypothetical protein
LNLVWEKLLPALNTSTTPAGDNHRRTLTDTLKELSLRPQEGTMATPEMLKRISGVAYSFPTNSARLETIALDSRAGSTALLVRFNGVEGRIDCGDRAWKKSNVPWGSEKLQRIAATGAWTSDDTFTAKICLY